jgi:photosystem II stability/assembly factor-like uncharacterized protein
MVLARIRSMFLLVIVSSFLFLTPFAKAARMKLLTPEVGWVIHHPGLMWTTDGGNHWKNITPPLPPGEHIASVFFLNTQQGWALLSGPGEKGSDEPHFDLAVTNNAGARWSIANVTFPPLPHGFPQIYGPASMDFLDSLHGWINMRLETSAAVMGGVLLETDDGGKTWNWSPRSPGIAGELCFVTTEDGWLAGGPAGKLYVTHDGATTWQEVSLQPPQQAGRAIYATYGLPVFENGEDGLLPVTFSGTEGVNSVLVSFATTDAGRTWTPDAVVPISKQTSIGQGIPATLAASTLITADVSGNSLTLIRAKQGSELSASASIKPPRAGVVALSFASTMDGWALVEHDGTATNLLSTSDGGNTWTDITPHPPQKSFPPAKPPKWRSVDPLTGRPLVGGKPQATVPSAAPVTQPLSFASESSLTLAPSAPGGGGGGGGAVHPSVHLGFDKSYVLTMSGMGQWWTYSPYYDTSVYLPGSHNRGTDANLTKPWINDVESQGWGLIPIWFGLQSACACDPSKSQTSCLPYDYLFGTESDGEQEATSAEASAQQLGLPTGTVIYKDIENFDTSNTACGNAVKDFVSGWVTRLKRDHYSAGVYTNPGPAQDYVSQAQPMPDEVWIGKWDGRATIWGLGNLADTLWTGGQRIHQHIAPHAEMWGSASVTCPPCLDSDIEDAPVAGSNGTKTGTFVVNSFLTGLYFPAGINDVVSNGTGVTFKYNEGQIAGGYNVDVGYGFLWDPNVGFIQTPISYGAYTFAEDINNTGQVVGAWNTFNDLIWNYHGLLFQNGSYASYDYPGTTGGTFLNGINDDGQMAGYYEDTNFIDHGFLLPSLVDLPQDITIQGATSIVALGINGVGQIVGNYEDSRGKVHGFFYDPHSGSPPDTIDCKGASITELFDINNNQQIAGDCDDYSKMFVYDYVHKAFTFIPFSEPQLRLLGINDGDQMVGYAVDPSSSAWFPFTVTETH